MRIGIFFFTGTGNTEFVAREFKAAFEPGHRTELVNVEFLPGRLGSEHFDAYDLLVFGAPVLAFNAPKFFVRFLRGLPPGNGKRTVLFLNSGGEALAGLGYPRFLLRRKGYQVVDEAVFITPGNMILRSKNEATGELIFGAGGWTYIQNARQMFGSCRARVRRVARRILAGGSGIRRFAAGPWLVSEALRFIFYQLACNFFKWQVVVARSCTVCGICAFSCPTGNIHIEGTKVRFASRCTVCYRCINVCPKMAIRIGWPFGALGNSVAYRAPGWKAPVHKR